MMNNVSLSSFNLWAFISFSVLAFPCFSADILDSPNTLRILNNIDERRGKMTAEGISAAKSLNKEGDKAYLQQDYRKAYRAYYNSYPNYPNAYAYIMAGDTSWRMLISYNKAMTSEQHCQLNNKYFPHDLDQDISQTYEVGLALAVKDKEIKLMESSIYKRAIESHRCLRKLYYFYKSQPSDVCIDVNNIQTCLGKPLIE